MSSVPAAFLRTHAFAHAYICTHSHTCTHQGAESLSALWDSLVVRSKGQGQNCSETRAGGPEHINPWAKAKLRLLGSKKDSGCKLSHGEKGCRLLLIAGGKLA